MGDGFQISSHVQHLHNPPTVRIKTIENSMSPPSPTFQPPPPPPPPLNKIISSSTESINNKWPINDNNKTDFEYAFRGKDNNISSEGVKDSMLIVVEEGKQPNFRANESNPTVPSLKEPSKTSTLRLSDRQRSGTNDN